MPEQGVASYYSGLWTRSRCRTPTSPLHPPELLLFLTSCAAAGRSRSPGIRIQFPLMYSESGLPLMPPQTYLHHPPSTFPLPDTGSILLSGGGAASPRSRTTGALVFLQGLQPNLPLQYRLSYFPLESTVASEAPYRCLIENSSYR